MKPNVSHDHLESLQHAVQEANKALESASQRYADAIAEVLNISIGSVVRIPRRWRYRVYGFKYTSIYPHLALLVVRIRKDGTDGQSRVISGTWTVEGLGNTGLAKLLNEPERETRYNAEWRRSVIGGLLRKDVDPYE